MTNWRRKLYIGWLVGKVRENRRNTVIIPHTALGEKATARFDNHAQALDNLRKLSAAKAFITRIATNSTAHNRSKSHD